MLSHLRRLATVSARNHLHNAFAQPLHTTVVQCSIFGNYAIDLAVFGPCYGGWDEPKKHVEEEEKEEEKEKELGPVAQAIVAARASDAVFRPRILVQKFGGTCLKDEESAQRVCDIVLDHAENYDLVVPVFSAVSGASKAAGTSSLIMESLAAASQNKFYGHLLHSIELLNIGDPLYTSNAVHDTLGRLCKRARINGLVNDYVLDKGLKQGENMAVRGVLKRLSGRGAFLCGEYWRDLFNESESFDQDTAIERVQDLFCKRLQQNFNGCTSTPIWVCSGHIGMVNGGILKAVGRGYTDYTATLIAEAIGADELQIWKESAGVYQANPGIVRGAAMLDEVSVEELVELTAFGNEVVHPLAAQLVKDGGFKTSIKDVERPHLTTEVVAQHDSSSSSYTAVCSMPDVSVVDIVCKQRSPSPQFLQSVFAAFAATDIETKLVSTSMGHVSVVFKAPETKRTALVALLQDQGAQGRLRLGRSIVACVGQGMAGVPGTAADITNIFRRSGINIEMLSQGCTEISVCAVVENRDCDKALKALHEALF